MDTLKINRKNVKMIAHRGLSGLECENTAAAFIAAANRSYYGIESDVHVTADGKFIMHHDDTTGRVFTSDLKISQCSYKELSLLCAKQDGKAAPSPFRRDLVIPTLEDYITICRRYSKTAVLEIKNEFTADNIHRLLEEIENLGFLENTVFISFVWENLIKIRTFKPHQALQFLTSSCEDGIIQKLIHHHIGLDAHFKSLTSDAVKRLHDVGLEVNCWTVNTTEDAEKLINLGVNYITTNILE